MVKYTWDDVIINPNSEQAKACIGKEVYCADTPYYCLEKANDNEVYDTVYILQKILPNDNYPFRLGENAEYEHCCIIPKKEEPKEYVPFDNIEEFIKASLEHNKEHILSKVGGIWVKEKPKPEIDSKIFITSIDCFELTEKELCFGEVWNYFDELLKGYTFLDGTPCGKLKE